MKIATAGSRTSKRWRTQDMSWDAFLAKLRTPMRTGETFAEYQRMDKAEKAKKKEAAGGFVGGAMSGGRRIAGAVTERWLVTLDADEAREGDWDNAEALADFAMAVYSTHSHSHDHPRLRWIIPLRAPVSREQYQPLARMLALELGILETLDASTYQPERLMYWPTAAADGEYVEHELEGPILDPASILARYGSGNAWKDSSLWPIASREKEIVLREVKRQADPAGKPGIVGVFCRTYDVPAAIDEFLSDVYDEAGEGRYTYTQGSTAAGAVLYEDGAFLYSNHATDPCGGLLCNAFDLVRIHKFGAQDDGRQEEDTTKLPSYKAMCAWCAGLPEVKRQVVAERIEEADADFSDLGDPAGPRTRPQGDAGAEASAGPGTQPEDDSWIDKLSINHKSGETDPTIENARLIMEHDPALRGAMATNLLSAKPVLLRDVPWRKKGTVTDTLNGTPWTDTDDAGLRLWLEKRWKLKGRQVIQDAWELVRERHAFHPIRDYLSGLTWDGVERLDTMIVRWLRARDDDYVRAATRKWMCAAVARVFEPGRKFDNMLVLVGPQGVGKSSLAIALSRGWFTDSLTSLSGKDAYESLRGAWIIELAELAAAKRSEIETIKNFVTKQEDMYRPAYGRHTVVYPRQCVFYGTTNDPEFLKDRSGNRRFWPIEVEGFDRGRLTGLREEVDQLWAEAVVRYKAGESLWMDTDELWDLATEAQDEHTVQDDLVGLIVDYLDKPLPDNWEDLSPEDRRDYIQGRSVIDAKVCTVRRDWVSVPEIRVELLEEKRSDIGRNGDLQSRRISDALNHLPGWGRGKSKRVAGYGKQKVFIRLEDDCLK